METIVNCQMLLRRTKIFSEYLILQIQLMRKIRKFVIIDEGVTTYYVKKT